jgi:hypothetical protein
MCVCGEPQAVKRDGSFLPLESALRRDRRKKNSAYILTYDSPSRNRSVGIATTGGGGGGGAGVPVSGKDKSSLVSMSSKQVLESNQSPT